MAEKGGLQLSGGDAAAVVAERYDERGGVRHLDKHDYLAALLGIFQRIIEDIVEHLLYSRRVARHRSGQARDIVDYLDALFDSALLECKHDLVKLGKGVHLLGDELHPAAAHA